MCAAFIDNYSPTSHLLLPHTPSFTSSLLLLPPPPSLSPDILLSLSEIAPDLQNAISLLCESWWTRELDEGERFVPHCLLYIVARTLADGATVSKIGLEIG